jgi:pimeloyl-ACP methyl ester carboxylesterase
MSAMETTRISLPTGGHAEGGAGRAGGRRGDHPAARIPRIAPHLAACRPGAGAGSSRARADQRGFGASDKPVGVEKYNVHEAVGDVLALADAYGIGRFTLVGHDWGGAVAWTTALKHAGRLNRLVIVNAPHPLIFQRSVIEDQEQRLASQYIRLFRSPMMEKTIDAMGVEAFFEKSFGGHVDLAQIPAEERQALTERLKQEGALTAMLNWSRASQLRGAEPDEASPRPA